MDKVYWDEQFRKLLGDVLPLGLIRRCLYSIQFNDEAHNLDHVYDVCLLACELCDRNQISFNDRKIIVAGALMHDLGCRFDRDTHHFISYGMAMAWLDTDTSDLFNDKEKYLVGRSCLEHRASYKGKFHSWHSEYVALADRGIPDIKKYIGRAINFRKEHNLALDVLKEEVYKHLMEKFAPEVGYAWKNYPALGKELFSDEWESFFQILLDSEKCNVLIESIATAKA